MTNLLLITDVPRLVKIFNQLAGEINLNLRTASSLEGGGEEIVTEKPALIFVQTHLSGLSADILLKHLKKQLGRKRSKFVLLSAASQVGSDIINLYNGHIDTSLDEKELSSAIKRTLATLIPKMAGIGEPEQPAVQDVVSTSATSEPSAPTAARKPRTRKDAVSQPHAPSVLPEPSVPAVVAPFETPPEPSLVEQGVTYSPRQRIKVYSEFTSSFDSAVGDMSEPEPPSEPPKAGIPLWDIEHLETIEPKKRFTRFSFFIWLAPILIAVLVVTILQHRKSQKTTGALPESIPDKGAVTAPQNTASPSQTLAAASKPVSPSSPATGSKAEEPSPQSDKSIISAIAENRGHNDTSTSAQTGSARLTTLPEFIPRYGADKAYSVANPGWERYKGQVTEFKVYREKNNTIKSIQVIDRGGKGVPESFMRAVLQQVHKKPVFVKESTEKKEGYEIQRGHIADTIAIVYYRDEQGGRLRAFALTWQ